MLCGWTLARAHARSGDRIAIAAYLGSSASFDKAIASFAESYADQNERDYDALAKAISDGRIEARAGVRWPGDGSAIPSGGRGDRSALGPVQSPEQGEDLAGPRPYAGRSRR